jgi:hypothetical protein
VKTALASLGHGPWARFGGGAGAALEASGAGAVADVVGEGGVAAAEADAEGLVPLGVESSQAVAARRRARSSRRMGARYANGVLPAR